MTHPTSREIPIEPAHTALLYVDVQRYNCTWDGGEYAGLTDGEILDAFSATSHHLSNLVIELDGDRATAHG